MGERYRAGRYVPAIAADSNWSPVLANWFRSMSAFDSFWKLKLTKPQSSQTILSTPVEVTDMVFSCEHFDRSCLLPPSIR